VNWPACMCCATIPVLWFRTEKNGRRDKKWKHKARRTRKAPTFKKIGHTSTAVNPKGLTWPKEKSSRVRKNIGTVTNCVKKAIRQITFKVTKFDRSAKSRPGNNRRNADHQANIASCSLLTAIKTDTNPIRTKPPPHHLAVLIFIQIPSESTRSLLHRHNMPARGAEDGVEVGINLRNCGDIAHVATYKIVHKLPHEQRRQGKPRREKRIESCCSA
jgi:hypothetical protein